MSEQQIAAAAKELHEYVKSLVEPWTDFRGHELAFATILRKHNADVSNDGQRVTDNGN